MHTKITHTLNHFSKFTIHCKKKTIQNSKSDPVRRMNIKTVSTLAGCQLP